MKQPEVNDPFKSNAALFAWLFGQLSGTYSVIAQYEREEERRKMDLFSKTPDTKDD